MRPTKWTKWVAIAGVTAMLASGCSLIKSKDGAEIDPPQNTTGALDPSNPAAVPTGASPEQQKGLQVTIYAKDPNGYVVPVSVQIPQTESVARRTLEYMVEDGIGKDSLPPGFTALLPKGTQIKGLSINSEKKVATVDFSKEFTNYNVQDERKIVEAVTWALTGFPTVKEVNIWVEGRQLKEMPQGGLPLDGALSRAIGINLEKAEDAEFGQTTPVTLYFLAQTDGPAQYYVPVTRMIRRTEDKAKATVEQLIQGPMNQSRLTPVIAPSVEVPTVEMSENLITVNFSDTLLGPDAKAPVEALQALVLSLTETSGQSKVQIKVNGDTKVNASNNQTYSQPVTRPANINPLKL
jgi:germination protein M